MREPRRLLTTAFSTALTAACLLATAGCRGDRSPGDADGRDEDHAGHVIPAHKPKAFPEAVHRLRELNDEIGRNLIEGRPGARSIQVALDIAGWLPEIAADSDMPEARWKEANARSARLVEDYQEIVSGTSANARGVVEEAKREIGNLERLLLASDPEWFGGTGKVATAPSPGAPVVRRP